MPDRPFRVTFVLTHPAQYMAPWFRHIASARQDVSLHVLYGTEPSPAAQAAGFGGAFAWDLPLRDGYASTVLAPALSDADVHASRFSKVDAPQLEDAILETAPDAVVIPGWHAALYLRAFSVCRQHGIPSIYRGDSTLTSGPSGWRRPLWRLATRRRLRRYDAWLSVGTRAREYLAAFDVPEPLVFASPHAVDNARFTDAAVVARRPDVRARLRHELGVPPEAQVVLCAGKLMAQKRPTDLIRAAARTASPVHLLFAGAGAEEPACRALASELGVAATFAGFLNQTRMPDAFAAADCLALPSQSETWGLVVNEALASGLPCIVTDGVGCGPDLIEGELTGRIVPRGDVDALASAIDAMMTLAASGAPVAEACRARADTHGFARATEGLVLACERLRRRTATATTQAEAHPRILACCGNMVIPGGLERMTFAALGACRDQGAAVHAVVNGWESSRIVALAEAAGASWSTGRYWTLFRRTLDPVSLARMAIDMIGTSAGLLRDARRFRPSHVLVPEWMAVLRNWPALFYLRLRGAVVVMRLGNAPNEGRFHAALWTRAIGPIVDRFIANSQFIADELVRTGIDRSRVEVVHNAPSRESLSTRETVDRTRVVFVGQIIPPKGVDLLLDAVAIVASRGIPVTLEIVGDLDGWESPSYGGHRARLRARSAAPDLAGRVVFAGHRDDVIARLSTAAVHACPSRPEQREGLAGTVLEAKVAGVPSVVTPTGSLPELVRHGVDGWIAYDSTAEAIAEGLVLFLGDPGLRDAAGSEARRSLERFSQSRFAAAWGRVFGIDPSPPVAPADRRAVRAS